MKRVWLEKIRKERSFTHQDIANSVNISRQYYGMIENGERDPSVSLAKKIGKLLNFEWTLFFENNSYKMLQKQCSA